MVCRPHQFHQHVFALLVLCLHARHICTHLFSLFTFSNTVMSVHPLFWSMSDKARPAGPPPMIRAPLLSDRAIILVLWISAVFLWMIIELKPCNFTRRMPKDFWQSLRQQDLLDNISLQVLRICNNMSMTNWTVVSSFSEMYGWYDWWGKQHKM
jgi:hypothetical protein